MAESVTIATSRSDITTDSNAGRQSFRAAYRALLVFSVLYFYRPEDLLKGISVVPVGKICGGVAVIALVLGFIGNHGRVRFPREVKIMLILFAHLCITVLFASWHGGAFDAVINKFSKAVIVAILVSMVVSSQKRLRALLLIHSSAVMVITIGSLGIYRQSRMTGALGGVYGNPNELAINIALCWPLCFAFLLASRNPLKKALWGIGMLLMLWGVLATYSRSGFLAMVVGALFCLVEFGIRGRRLHLLLLAFIVSIIAMTIAPQHYYARLGSIFLGNQVEGSMDHGSADARKELLKLGLWFMVRHPLFGVGPQNFPTLSGAWRMTHNTYTEFGAEAGLPALVLFLWIIGRAFSNLKAVRQSALYRDDVECRLVTGALFASFGAYVVGAFFADTAYHLFPYYMVAYTTGLCNVACPVVQASRARIRLSWPTPSAEEELISSSAVDSVA